MGYPVITSDPEYTHEGSILNIIGEEKSSELRELVSMEKRVSENTPPTFIWHCADDGCVRVENTLWYMCSLSKYHIPFESHIYEYGGHGLALCDETTAMGRSLSAGGGSLEQRQLLIGYIGYKNMCVWQHN